MKILIAGASGFIGQALVAHWQGQHQLSLLGRDHHKMQRWQSDNLEILEWSQLPEQDAHSYDAVINLCGKNISENRWSDSVKQDLIDSRVKTTRTLIQWIQQQQAHPHFYCANAVGIYGLQASGDSQKLDEHSPVFVGQAKDFLQDIGRHWQEAAEEAKTAGMPLTITRFGVVLKKGEGILKKLSPSFYCGLGSVIGNGEQMLSWIHIDDLVRAFDFLLQHPDKLQGPVNLCAPHPSSQKDFARALAKAMHRPLFLKTPPRLIRFLFGEMGECLMNRGQAVVPTRLLDAGFQFNYPDIAPALWAEWGN